MRCEKQAYVADKTCVGKTGMPNVGSRSEHQADTRDDKQAVDGEPELSIGKPSEDAQSKPRAEEGSGHESERVPVQLRQWRG